MEKNYFFIDDQNTQRGPFSAEGLSKEGIRKNTLVWYEGLSDWTSASNIYELASIFDSIPTPLPFPPTPGYGSERMNTRDNGYINEPIPKTWFLESILITILCCLPLGIAGMYFASKVEPSWRLGEYREAKKYSKNAGIFVKISIVLFGIGLLMYILMFKAMMSFNPMDAFI